MPKSKSNNVDTILLCAVARPRVRRGPMICNVGSLRRPANLFMYRRAHNPRGLRAYCLCLCNAKLVRGSVYDVVRIYRAYQSDARLHAFSPDPPEIDAMTLLYTNRGGLLPNGARRGVVV
ncbi:hypothetical protein EVAR_5408_1 [Eumeta japonica]|uniref:Uncharacterized protein n=1 Tax=Eumeta variegata TaxID=151549 RepID=A0A4C1TB54_EUMVA|nr:hypothetical protein EVAR_5408_1 [Eumeta japonica]